VFAGLAAHGKTSMGWFYGFKLHLTINEQGELLSWLVTPGNVDDRVPVATLVKHLWGRLFGDKGYLSQELTRRLFRQHLHLITKLKRTMKQRLLRWSDALLLHQRGVVESVIDLLKNHLQIQHTRHRSVHGFFINLFSALAAYALLPNKPSIHAVSQRPLLIQN